MRWDILMIGLAVAAVGAGPATKPTKDPEVIAGITPILRQMPKELRPGSKGWDEFTLPKVNAWAEDFKGKKIRLSLPISFVSEIPISIEGDPNHVQAWEIAFGTGAAEASMSELPGDVSFQNGTGTSVTVRSDEKFARAVKDAQGGTIVVEGSIKSISISVGPAPNGGKVRAFYAVFLSGVTVRNAGRAKSPTETYIEDHHSKPEIADAIRAGHWVSGMTSEDQMLVNDGPGIYLMTIADQFGNDGPRVVTRATGQADAIHQGYEKAGSYRKNPPFYVTSVQLRTPEPDK